MRKEVWVDKQGKTHDINQMSTIHIVNIMYMVDTIQTGPAQDVIQYMVNVLYKRLNDNFLGEYRSLSSENQPKAHSFLLNWMMMFEPEVFLSYFTHNPSLPLLAQAYDMPDTFKAMAAKKCGYDPKGLPLLMRPQLYDYWLFMDRDAGLLEKQLGPQGTRFWGLLKFCRQTLHQMGYLTKDKFCYGGTLRPLFEARADGIRIALNQAVFLFADVPPTPSWAVYISAISQIPWDPSELFLPDGSPTPKATVAYSEVLRKILCLTMNFLSHHTPVPLLEVKT